MEILQMTCSDQKELMYRVWLPENKNIHSIVHIFHGMAEHGARYDDFAQYLNTLGIAVYAQDHRGHGLTATDDELGWFADKNGWKRVVEDGFELSQLIRSTHPGNDIFLLGHSMGSFLVRYLITQHPALYAGVILSGTGASQGVVGAMGKLLARIRSLSHKGRNPDKLLDHLSFGAFAKGFTPQKTTFDWLSRDEAAVQAYLDDPLCGFICTSRFFVDLLDGITLANKKSLIRKIPLDMPILIISGANDPVGDFGKGVEKVFNLYQKAGIEDVTISLIKGARHEILNETNRKETFRVLGTWLEAHKSRQSR